MIVSESTPEVWRDIPGFEGYYSVSNIGRVRREKASMGTRPGRLLKLTTSGKGYVRVTLHRDGSAVRHLAHRLVAAAFLEQEPGNLTVNHIDGNKANNFVGNLEYVSHAQNIQHAIAHGLRRYVRGEAHGQSKLTDTQVKEIRSLAGVVTQRKMAEMFGVSKFTIQSVVRGELWQHVKADI